MKKTALAIAAICTLAATTVTSGTAKKATDTSPAEDLATYQHYYTERFPGIPLDEFGNGVYAIDKVSRDSWEAIEEFPPYEPMIDDGETLWNTAFKNGKTYASCFPDGPAQRKNYPHWDGEKVVTMPMAVNACREANGEEPLKYIKDKKLNALLAYMSYESRGQKTNVVIPDDKALEAYNKGKQFYFARRGQLNFSCAQCHMESPGMYVRTDILSPSLGHTTGFPVYRSKWGRMGTLHRRFTGCNKQVRAKAFKAQGEEYRNLEYFLTHMSNGMEYNGPSARK